MSKNLYIKEITDMDTDMDTDIMDIPMDIDIDMDSDSIIESESESDIDDLIADFEKVSFFGDQKRYIELLEYSKMEISEFETDKEVEIILDKTFKRYRIYLKCIGYMDKNIKYDLEKFIKKFQDYENVDDTQLFNYMNYIDNKIVDKINEVTT